MRRLGSVIVTALAFVPLAAACSDNVEKECEDGSACGVGIPTAITSDYAEGESGVLSWTTDFNGDGEQDWVATYGPILQMTRTPLKLATLVRGKVIRFSDPASIAFTVRQLDSDGYDDLAIWHESTRLWTAYTWTNDDWVELDNFPALPPYTPEPPVPSQ